ncbi:conserved hypothetical protein [Gloeothece citriformis PCC 7424]|uniref:Uncharacterized protein n=1 Tax=Gloeothece citriformis (strain PCC 7424) TaxID=65393 RepID=B7KBJ8_GLOC7|nr:hypothetical protein [Gloeothece citriformis]ACK72976.1 conserved hypothetical protein [Gloeothece citriformis PCC 7424]
MNLKIVENFEASFSLSPEAEEVLFKLLEDEQFLGQISQQVKAIGVEFTKLLFQPVPYSQKTPKGMLPEFETYHYSEDYIIINVPPQFMFKAKIFNPSRLCAIYKKKNSSLT